MLDRILMKNNLLAPILALVLLTKTSNVFSNDEQFLPGYIVQSSGDTLSGYVLVKDHFFNTRNCVFRPENANSSKPYLPGEVLAYGIRNKGYYKLSEISTSTGLTKVFLECIVQGR